MKKFLAKTAVAAVLGVGLVASSSMANIPSEWGIVTPVSLFTSGNPVGSDGGYYIWASDETLTSWHVRWKDPNFGSNGTSWWGTIELQNATGSFATFSFDNSEDEINYEDGDTIAYVSATKKGVDGIDFTITQVSSPSFVGFSLSSSMFQFDSSDIFLGSNNITVSSFIKSDGKPEDNDFSIAAPVPEPGVTLLFGLGVAGFVGVIRQRKTHSA